MGLGQSSKAPVANDTGEGELTSNYFFTSHNLKQGWEVKQRGGESCGELIFVITG